MKAEEHRALGDAASAGIDEVEIAYGLGRSGRSAGAEALYAAVWELAAAPGDCFRPEVWIPRPSPENPPQNWRGADVEELWDSPIVGHRGTIVGDAVTDPSRRERTFRAGSTASAAASSASWELLPSPCSAAG